MGNDRIKAKKGGKTMEETALSENIIKDMYNNTRHKKLSKEQETLLIKRIKLSYYDEATEEERQKYLEYYFEARPGFKARYLIATEEEKQKLLAKAIEDAKKHRNEFLKNNLRFILYVVSKMSNIYISHEELIQEGIIGMMNALKSFEFDYDVKFTTYASWKIRQKIHAYCRKNNTLIKISANFNELQLRVGKVTEELVQKLQREPTAKEIAEAVGITESQVIDIQRIINDEFFPISIAATPKTNDDETIESLIKDPAEDIEGKITEASFEESIKKDLLRSQMPAKWKLILILRYGITYEHIDLPEQLGRMIELDEKKLAILKKMVGKPQTLEEIGQLLDLTKERVRQIEARALRDLRTPGKTRKTLEDSKHSKTKPPVIQLTEEEKLEIITEEINKLDEFPRHIIYLLHMRNLSVHDISTMYGITENEIENIELSFAFKLKKRFAEKRSEKSSKQLKRV